MSSVAPTRSEFAKLLEYVKSSDNIMSLFSNKVLYIHTSAYPSFIPCDEYLLQGGVHVPTLHKMLNVVQQLAMRYDFEGFSRVDAVNFIALFKLNPTLELCTVKTTTFGEEALRILNCMALAVNSDWKNK